MYLFNFHTEPLPTADKYSECKGAYVAVFIDYKDYYGALELAKYYVQASDWKILEIENEYWVLESEEDIEEDNMNYYEEALETGYSVIFNLYENENE
ncbi:MAG: hypothetical protein AAGF85_20225 [Bacteroidota bacterium]